MARPPSPRRSRSAAIDRTTHAGCKLYSERLESELASVDDLLSADLPSLSHGLSQRQSNNRLAVLFDLLFHPNADYTELAEPHDQPTQTCLGLTRSNRSHAHVVVGDEAAGGSWHTMRGSTLALSPGYWMELPGLEMNASKLSEPPRSWRPTRESRRSGAAATRWPDTTAACRSTLVWVDSYPTAW